MIPCVRLNGTSDIAFESVRGSDGLTLFEKFPDLQFYDYTKRTSRVYRFALRRDFPQNYYLLLSRSERTSADAVRTIVRSYRVNVAVVFRERIPDSYLGIPVFNGETDDLRFLDPSPAIIGLVAKAKAKTDELGFTVGKERR